MANETHLGAVRLNRQKITAGFQELRQLICLPMEKPTQAEILQLAIAHIKELRMSGQVCPLCDSTLIPKPISNNVFSPGSNFQNYNLINQPADFRNYNPNQNANLESVLTVPASFPVYNSAGINGAQASNSFLPGCQNQYN